MILLLKIMKLEIPAEIYWGIAVCFVFGLVFVWGDPVLNRAKRTIKWGGDRLYTIRRKVGRAVGRKGSYSLWLDEKEFSRYLEQNQKSEQNKEPTDNEDSVK